mmetsp:Transcript_76901/g.186062  ORF Transcript_76901/g.186062 Transcript_76901/m.186062 type:complete len:324 (-) Transcript_76901:451-1422(-)
MAAAAARCLGTDCRGSRGNAGGVHGLGNPLHRPRGLARRHVHCGPGLRGPAADGHPRRGGDGRRPGHLRGGRAGGVRAAGGGLREGPAAHARLPLHLPPRREPRRGGPGPRGGLRDPGLRLPARGRPGVRRPRGPGGRAGRARAGLAARGAPPRVPGAAPGPHRAERGPLAPRGGRRGGGGGRGRRPGHVAEARGRGPRAPAPGRRPQGRQAPGARARGGRAPRVRGGGPDEQGPREPGGGDVQGQELGHHQQVQPRRRGRGRRRGHRLERAGLWPEDSALCGEKQRQRAHEGDPGRRGDQESLGPGHGRHGPAGMAVLRILF